MQVSVSCVHVRGWMKVPLDSYISSSAGCGLGDIDITLTTHASYDVIPA